MALILSNLAQWATFPLLLLAFQAGDVQALLDNRTVGATLHGADRFEKARRCSPHSLAGVSHSQSRAMSDAVFMLSLCASSGGGGGL